MLILTRRVGETVMIGNEVTVTVLGVKGNQVRVGVNAPKDIAVHREEIFRRIHRQESAVGPSSTPHHRNLADVVEHVAPSPDREEQPISLASVEDEIGEILP